MTTFYNEIDPYAAQWLRNLIEAGHLAPGVVDERSIEDIEPRELHQYTQCHFFAGIGVWSHALRLAGWPDDRPVWTGSCPCQPFSAAGKGAGFDDERHLWPAFYHLIAQCRPPVVIGEQVASKAVDPWIDLVHADLEAVGYAFGAVPFPSAGVGAPHIRDRCYWVAHADDAGSQGRVAVRQRAAECVAGPGGVAGGLADTELHDGPGWLPESHGRPSIEPDRHGVAGRLADDSSIGRERRQDASRPASQVSSERGEGLCDAESWQGADLHDADGRGPVSGFWAGADWLPCRDEKWRPVESGTFPLAHGAPARVGRLRAYGNAIVAQAAAAFIEAVGFEK
jgi:DNA (cytosine-5)-methyltransferase 1